MSEAKPVHPSDLKWYPTLKAWADVPEYKDACFASRTIVDAALRLFMERGSVPDDPDALRNAIGAAGWHEYPKLYPAARVAITALLPLWQAELEKSLAFVVSRRGNGGRGGRPSKGKAAPDGQHLDSTKKPSAIQVESLPIDTVTVTVTEIAKAISPKPRRSARDGGGIPEGFDAFWEAFKARYPKRPGQPWSVGKEAMLKAMRNHPDLDRQAVLDAAAAYCELMVSTNKAGTDKVAHASTWLNQGRWECDFTMAPREDDGPLF